MGWQRTFLNILAGRTINLFAWAVSLHNRKTEILFFLGDGERLRCTLFDIRNLTLGFSFEVLRDINEERR